MAASPAFHPPSPGQVRAALSHHLARRMGWGGRTAAHLLGPLSSDEIARCLAVEPAELRKAVFAGLSVSVVSAAGRCVAAREA